MSQAIGMGITGLAAYQGFANGNTGTTV